MSFPDSRASRARARKRERVRLFKDWLRSINGREQEIKWQAGPGLDLTDPLNPVFLGDSDFAPVDPELLEQTGVSLTPEGNAHQAEFTSDNRFVIATDEDFAPYRVGEFRITSGEFADEYPSVIDSGGASPATLPDLTLNGPVVYGGYGCPASAPIPSPEDIPGYLDMLDRTRRGEDHRPPAGAKRDPSAPEEACFPGEKAHEAELAGWDAVLFVQRHVSPDDPFCGSGAFVDEIVAVCTTLEAFHKLFTSDVGFTYPEPQPALGTIGERIEVTSIFEGGATCTSSGSRSAARAER
ncbi:MAG: hypothetical protein H0V71_10865 [Chloroflexi bacterium]|nr:hypothetical protein [Chloroflexota bacterium]